MEVVLKPRAPTEVSTWSFIRTRLLVAGGDYCYRSWKEFVRYLEQQFKQAGPTYQSFARYWWTLKQLGLIEPIGPPRPGRGGRPRQFYHVTPGKESERLWPLNPQAALYGDSVRLGKRRYSRRVLKRPPKPSGRPKRISF